MPDSFCPAPFRSLYFNGGKFRPCCWFDKDALALRGHSVGDAEPAFRSKEMDDIRAAMVRAEKVEGCWRCDAHESIGAKSHRDFWLARSFTDLAPRDPAAHLKALDLHMGNLCNLKCITCSGADSSGWFADEARLEGRSGRLQRADLSNINWQDFGSVEWIKFAGGEVLLMPEHLSFLEELVARGLSHRISLNYVTNATVHPAQFEQAWSKFREVRVILSLDGVGAIAEYARPPAKWEIVEDTVRAFLGKPEINVEANTVVSVINVYHLPELRSWWLKVAGGAPQFLRLIDRPARLRIQRLPERDRITLRARLAGVQGLEPVIEGLLGEVEPGWQESLAWISRLDDLRGNDFYSLNPWLHSR